MNEIERSTGYLATLEINNKNSHESLKLINKQPQRTITVCATGEFALPPDRFRLTLSIKSSKEQVEEAKQSVNRRFEYVFQTLRKNKVKEADINVSKVFNRQGKFYEVVYEVSAVFDDLKVYEHVQNQFVEKLDSNVTLFQPKFFLTASRTENIKRQASIKAMKNAKKIGFDLARSCNLALSKPICIIEESSQIREGIFLDQHSQDHPKSINEMIEERTVSANVAIKVTFELRAKPKELADCSKLN